MKTSTIRDMITRALKNTKNLAGMVKEDIDGYYFSAAETALLDKDGNCEVFRIIVIKYNRKSS